MSTTDPSAGSGSTRGIMNHQAHFLNHVRNNGQSAVYTAITGDACPCVNSATGYCDQEWHFRNPAPGDEDCNGTGLIDTVTTNTNIKAFILPKADLNEIQRQKVGLRAEDDYLFVGALNVSAETLFDISGFNADHDYITFATHKYILRAIDAEKIGDIIVYYFAAMKKRAA